MRVISKKMLREFWDIHPDCKEALKAWYNEAEKASWKLPEDIKREYPSASILKSKRIIFNIKGNTYRLVVRINYEYGLIWIRFIGTHEEYDRIDVNRI